jgi:hypothetical protein
MKSEKDEAEKSLWDSLLAAPNEAYDMIMDPNKKEREDEEKLRKEVKASKKQWRRIRSQRFAFLDASANRTPSMTSKTTAVIDTSDEKKMDESTLGNARQSNDFQHEA